MKIPLLPALLGAALLLLPGAGCSSKKDDPAAALAAAPVTYTDAAGKRTALSAYTAYSVTAPPLGGRSRRAVFVRAVLPDGSTLDLSYTFTYATFPAGSGVIALDAPVEVDHYGGPLPLPTHYQAAGITTGTLASETATPPTVSGTYSGPFAAGGGTVALTFSKLTF